jgi:flagella basal body P-ring formation protein FlgA
MRTHGYKRWVYLLAIISILFLGQDSLFAEEISLILLSEAEVSGNEIFVSDVISHVDINPDILYSLNLITLGRTPLPGSTRQISMEYVKSRLLQAGFKAQELYLKGAGSIVVKGGGESAPPDKLLNMAKEYIIENLGLHPDDIDILPISFPSQLLVPEEGELRFTPPQGRRFVGTILLPVEVLREGCIMNRDFIKMKVTARGSILVATKNLSRGHIIKEEDICIEERELSTISGSPAMNSNIVIGKMLNSTIKAGDVITVNMLSIPPAIRKGENIVIIAKIGSIEVETNGIALNEGMIGEIISVQNSLSGKKFNAVIIENGKVEILKGGI